MSHAWLKNASAGGLRPKLHGLRRVVGEAAARPGAALLKLPVLGELIASAIPAGQPPVLVASLPRAGSSWIGSVLGASQGALYLREPMTQSYLARVGRQHSPFFEWAMCRDAQAYTRFADRSFKGMPGFDGTIVPHPQQWSIAGRSRKQVVVKEVNPLILAWLHERFRPKIILLVRHPAPVTRSFQALGWTGEQFSTRFSPETLAAFECEHPLPRQGSFWEQGGAFQAIAQNLIWNSLEGIDHLLVRYEDVCTDPVSEFGRMFEYCGLPFSEAIRTEIERSSRAKPDYVPGRYDTERRSIDMKDRWKREMAPDEIEGVRRGYFAHSPIFYREEADWQQP